MNRLYNKVIDNKLYENSGPQRIHSIDALRAFALFGILLIHTGNGFGTTLGNSINSTIFSQLLMKCIVALVNGRCALIFNVLFGVSFYLILRKPQYSSIKFVWRCVLLMLIGVINKYFYGGDALLCYGFCGILLTFVRNLSNKGILSVAVLLYLISFVCLFFDLSLIQHISLPNRYAEFTSFREFNDLFLPTCWVYVRDLLSPNKLVILANFCIGYWLGKIGIIDNWDTLFRKKHILWSAIIYIFISVAYLVVYRETGILNKILCTLFNLAGGAFYTITLIWSYNHVHFVNKILSWFESYGKCGLTNYSMQNWFGVIFFYFCGLAFKGYSFVAIILCSVLFFILQNLFCRWWLARFNNGPMEYLWRCATERKILQFRKTRI